MGWQWGDLPLVLLLGLPLVLLGLGYGRLTSYLGRLGSWIVLVPVWVAGLYLLFQAMPRLLPPTL